MYINPELSFESAIWNNATDAKTAYIEGGDEIETVTMTACELRSGTLQLSKNTNIINGRYSDLRIGTDLVVTSVCPMLSFVGAYANSIYVDMDACTEITEDNNGDCAHVNSMVVLGRASIEESDIVFLTIDRTGYCRIRATAEVGNLEVYGTVDLQSIHVKHITLHAGGKILSKYPFDLSTIKTDEGRKPHVDNDGWICG